jgi:hypothetical protein
MRKRFKGFIESTGFKRFKRFYTLVIATVLLVGSLFQLASEAHAATVEKNNITVKINGEKARFDVQPYVNANKRTMVPIRFISESLGANVSWDGKTKTVTIIHGLKVIKLKINDRNVLIGKKMIELDSHAVIKEKRTFVPLRFITEGLGANIEWDGKEKLVSITTEQMIENIVMIRETIHTFEGFSGETVYTPQENALFIKLRDNEVTVTIYHHSMDKSVFNVDFYEFEDAEKEFLYELLKVYYPTSYEQAYQDVLGGERVDTTYDGRMFITYHAWMNLPIVWIGND